MLVAFALVVGYGIDSDDARRYEEFCNGVERWQVGPDFRQVAYEYVRRSHAAMNATPCGVPTTRLIMGLRSVPGLGPEYAVSPTSQAHYDDFTRGELSAYLHLCGEQTMDWVCRDLHDIASRGSRDEEIRHFLQAWKMNRPVASDAEAIAGVKRLLVDIDATKPIEPQVQVQAEIVAASSDLAKRLGFSSGLKELKREQEHAVFERLDADMRQRDPRLWRYKQISDLCSGIWAQTFGRDYTMVIIPVITARNACRAVAPLAALGMVWLPRPRRRV
jgi:hypothetical protein